MKCHRRIRCYYLNNTYNMCNNNPAAKGLIHLCSWRVAVLGGQSRPWSTSGKHPAAPHQRRRLKLISHLAVTDSRALVIILTICCPVRGWKKIFSFPSVSSSKPLHSSTGVSTDARAGALSACRRKVPGTGEVPSTRGAELSCSLEVNLNSPIAFCLLDRLQRRELFLLALTRLTKELSASSAAACHWLTRSLVRAVLKRFWSIENTSVTVKQWIETSSCTF